jgi:CheY-like chemotaxis protein
VVDDVPAVRAIVERLLARDGYTVVCAETGAAALALVDALDQPVHLLIADMRMPGISGEDLAVRLRARQPSMRVLLVSGAAEALNTARLSAPLLSKPFSPGDLLGKVREVLETV